jgi:ribosomal protein S18 acetylase RimI-like enzyme
MPVAIKKAKEPLLGWYSEGFFRLISIMWQLKKYRFDEADLDLPEIQAFDCGHQRWEVEAASWIKSRSGDNSALEDIKKWGIELWLYRLETGKLVGFASLGENTWSVPMPKGPKCCINYIPFIGVHRLFQGMPRKADRDDKFAYQILDDLIEYAAEKTSARTDLHPFIGLSVDRENVRAINFYKHRNFADVKTPRIDRITSVVYERMLLNIAQLVKVPFSPPDRVAEPS